MEENQIVADGVKKYVRFSNGESDVIDYGHRMYELIGKGERYKWKWILNRYHEVFHEKRNSTHIKDRHRHMEESGELKASYPADYDPPAGVLSLQTIRNDIRALEEEEYEFDFLRQEAEQMIVQLEQLAAQLEAEQAQAHDQHHPHLQDNVVNAPNAALVENQQPAAALGENQQPDGLVEQNDAEAVQPMAAEQAATLRSQVSALLKEQESMAKISGDFFAAQNKKISELPDMTMIRVSLASMRAVFERFFTDQRDAEKLLQPMSNRQAKVIIGKLRNEQKAAVEMVVEFFKGQELMLSDLQSGASDALGPTISYVKYGLTGFEAGLMKLFNSQRDLLDKMFA